MQVSTEVLTKGEARFWAGKKLPDSLHNTDQTISPGLVARLVRYGRTAMEQAGFVVEGWSCEVYTMDGDLPLSERYYCVEFVNAKGGRIGLQGVGIGRGGHPCIDHGYSVDFR